MCQRVLPLGPCKLQGLATSLKGIITSLALRYHPPLVSQKLVFIGSTRTMIGDSMGHKAVCPASGIPALWASGWLQVPHPQTGTSPRHALAQNEHVHGPSSSIGQYYFWRNLVPAPTTVGQPPRKDPQMENLPRECSQSELKYR
ncbi:hypothetical protein Tco_0145309 [Tanacetum coccineum]